MADRPMNLPPLDPAARAAFPLEAANRCVKCGLCLPHCPTYRLAGEEAESPRGRIALLQGLVEGQFALTERVRDHLDHCLHCRACERTCPADVPYGAVMDAGRRLYAPAEPRFRRYLGHLLRNGIVTRPPRLAALMTAVWLAQRGGLPTLFRRLGLARLFRVEAAMALLPPLRRPRRWKSLYPPEGANRGEVALFLGCIARHTDAALLRSAIAVLNRLGYTVHVPLAQGCCGALHAHAGDAATAEGLTAINLNTFDGYQTVVHLATGCGAQLLEGFHENGPRVVELTRFLAEDDWPVAPTHLAAADGTPLRVQIHLPCTARNVLRDTTAADDLLARLPGVTTEPLPGNAFCCGAGGDKMLTAPAQAAALRGPKLAEADGDWLVSTNPGCALHLAAGLPPGERARVTHPVALVARALGVDRGRGIWMRRRPQSFSR